MSLADVARASAPKDGRPSKLEKLRADLTPKSLAEFDEAMADATLTDSALAIAIERVHGVRVHETTVRNWRKAKGLK